MNNDSDGDDDDAAADDADDGNIDNDFDDVLIKLVIDHIMYMCVCIYIYMGMDQYLLIPFLGGWTSIYQLFWCSPGVQGFDTLPYIYIYNPGSFAPNIKTFQKRSPGGFVHFGVWGPGKPLSKLGGLQTPNNELTASCAKGSLNPNWMEREREKGLVVYCVCQSSNNRQWSLQEWVSKILWGLVHQCNFPNHTHPERTLAQRLIFWPNILEP